MVFALMAISHPILMATIWDEATYDPVTGYAFDQTEQPAPPSWKHPLGTDPLGRDVLSQLLSSTSSEFILGIVAAVVTVTIATTIGAVAAYYGGIADTLIMRLADLVVSPSRSVAPHSVERSFRTEPLHAGVIDRRVGRIWRLGHYLQVPGPGRDGQAVYRSSQSGRGRPLPHHFRAHHPKSAAPVLPVHDVRRDGSDLLRGDTILPGSAHIRMSWGIMIHTANTAGYLLGGTKYWWLIVPRRSIHHPALQHLLPGREGLGRSGQPEIAAALMKVSG